MLSLAWPHRRRLLLAMLLVLIGVSLMGCRRGAATDVPPTTPTPTASPVPPAAVQVTPTAPAVVSTPTPTVPPLPDALLALDGDSLISHDPLPDNVSPFTGLVVDDPARLDRMPAAVKISNSPIARPQSGLSHADIVIEHLAEGGITRFTAIYHSEDSERIGSVRSARLIDLEIPVLFDTFLVYSGANGEVTRLLDSSDFADRTLSDERKDPGFYRLEIPGRAWEHTLFTDTQLLWQVAEERGWTQRPRYRGWVWNETPPDDAEPARTIFIPYSSDYSDVRYEYEPEIESYRRWILDEPHVDGLTGEQLTVPNVVVLYVNHVETLIVEDVLGSKSVEIQLWGNGRMQLFRDGVVKEGFWLRDGREGPLLFMDGNGQPIPLKPGKTWIQIVPLDMEVTVGE